MRRLVIYTAVQVVAIWSLLLLFGASPLHAQQVGNCQPPLGEAYLDANNVRARILNNGMLFFRYEPHVYNIPKNSNSHSLFAGALWIGGLINGALHVSANRYWPDWTNFWAGPLDDNGEPPDDCAKYDRIYKITLEDVHDYESTGITSADLRDWPSGLGAPTLDADGSKLEVMDLPLSQRKDRLINLDAGERPDINGDQTLWWVMNDRGDEHLHTESPPLGLEVHGIVFAIESHIDAINDATFYRFRLINRNTSKLEQAYFGLFLDADLGNAGDDFVGSDSIRGIGFVYNSDNLDEGFSGYGTPPPALGVQFLQTPLAENDGLDNDHDGVSDERGEMLGMTHFAYWVDYGGVYGAPLNGSDYYNYMKGRWKNGERWTEGGRGHSVSDAKTNYIYPGDPVTGAYWSELNIDSLGATSGHADRVFMVSSGPFDLEPGEDTEFAFVIIWARGKDNLDSITEVRRAALGIRDSYEAILSGNHPFFSYYQSDPQPDPVPHSMGFDLVYPNPAGELGFLRYVVADQAEVTIELYDVLGRPIRTVLQVVKDPGWYTETIGVSDLPSGVYFYRISIGRLSATKPLTVVH